MDKIAYLVEETNEDGRAAIMILASWYELVALKKIGVYSNRRLVKKIIEIGKAKRIALKKLDPIDLLVLDYGDMGKRLS